MFLKVIRPLLFVLWLCNTSAAGQGQEVKRPEKKIVYFIPLFWGNDLFNPEVKNTKPYDMEPFYRLYTTADKAGYDLRVADPSYGYLHDALGKHPKNPQHLDGIVVFEVVDFQLKYLARFPNENLVLILWEPPTTMPVNYEPENHKIFSRVYTWRDDLVDNQKYFKIYYPVLRPMADNPRPFSERKLAVLVGANKQSWLPNELYSERLNVIDFFEDNHPNEFDFFGWGWPEDTYQTYRGKIEGDLQAKVEKLKGYKFVFSYENGKGIPGYITEKIFDCFAAGVVPIYWGAPNIASYIPKNCYISREDFKSHEALYDFLKNMTEDQYKGYIENIRRYLASEQAQVFSYDHFIKIMMDMLQRPIKIETPTEKTN